MHFLQEYASFLLNTSTIVIAIIIILITFFSLIAKNKVSKKGKIEINKLNDAYSEIENQLLQTVLSKKELKAHNKQQKKDNKNEGDTKKKMYVLHFNGDIRASQVEHFREEITAVLTVATPDDEVVVCLESPGGVVHGYGLAASQLSRIREHNIPLTVIVDKVAASGGYMMACVANKIVAAPFAIIGSIGVLLQLPNFNKLLKNNHIDYEQLTAGEYKRTLTMFGENTDKGREKMQAEIEETHDLFKQFINDNRPSVDLNTVATGEHWFANQAIDYHLVDKIQTSDDYLLSASKNTNLYEVKKVTKKTLAQKLGKTAQDSTDSLLTLWWQNRFNR